MCHAPSVGSIEPLTSPAIKSVTRESLNCTQVDAAHWLVLATHTRVWSHSYFGCPAHTLGRRECAARRRASHHLACVGKALCVACYHRSFGDDPLDGAGTAPAPDAAAEAIVDSLCARRLVPRCRHNVAYRVVTEHVA